MTTSADVKILITADGSQLRREIDSDIKALAGFASVSNKTNAAALSAFRASASAQREQLDTLGASTAQYAALDRVVLKFEADARRAGIAAARIVPTDRRLRAGAQDLGQLAFMASSAGGSLQGAAFAAGGLAQSLASMSRSASVAASATGIGALIVALGVLVGLAIEAKRSMAEAFEGTITETGKARIAAIKTEQQARLELAAVSAAADAALRKSAATGRKEDGQAATDLLEKRNEVQKRLTALTEEARAKAKAAARQDAAEAVAQQAAFAAVQQSLGNQVAASLDRLRQNTFDQRLADIARIHADETSAAAAMKGIAAAERAGIQNLIDLKLNAGRLEIEQARELARARTIATAGAGSDDPQRVHQARLAMIDAERDATIRAGGDVAAAEEIRAQAIRALRRQARDEALDSLRVLEDATISSKSRELRAVGVAAQIARRVTLGFKAAENTVDGIKEAGKALSYAAGGQFASAALAGASSLKHFAAAAFALKEGASGGGGGASGGGGGGAAQGARDSSRIGASLAGVRGDEPLKIEVLIRKEGTDGRDISRTRQLIERSKDRNEPIRMSA